MASASTKNAAAAAATTSTSTLTAAPLSGPEAVTATIDRINRQYTTVHEEYEKNFWATKMGLNGSSPEKLSSTKTALEEFLADPSNLADVEKALKVDGLSDDQQRTLECLRRTFAVSQLPDEASKLRAELNELEASLAADRREMKLGYEVVAKTKEGNPEFVEASTVQLRQILRSSDDEATRESAWKGLRSIGPRVAEQFAEIIKKRNAMARAVSADNEDYYDFKVKATEAMTKKELFEILGQLEERTRPLAAAARERLASLKGLDALKPWNRTAALAGASERALDPYFAFEDAFSVFARSFAALGISFSGGESTLVLDLCDRKGKYSNGFCHWPKLSSRSPTSGERLSAEARLSSLATPDAVGSGRTALTTLLHECGHAAHFANVVAFTPLAAQERAPTSVAYAETQSMFLDAFADDAGWQGRYCRASAVSEKGKSSSSPPPWSVIERAISDSHPYSVLALRAMLAVPFFEKELYELPDEEVTAERILKIADEVEEEIELGPSPRPLLSVPHPLSDESSAYYHGYVLAEMAVHQTRAGLAEKFSLSTADDDVDDKQGKEKGNAAAAAAADPSVLVDDERVGEALRSCFCEPGNTQPYLDLVEKVTGKPLSADAWVSVLEEPLESKLAREKAAFEKGVAAGAKIPDLASVDLGARVVIMHGDEKVADSAEEEGEGCGIAGVDAKFRAWIEKNWPRRKGEEGGEDEEEVKEA